jgi:zinc/manganese transport system substrate-binding protein
VGASCGEIGGNRVSVYNATTALQDPQDSGAPSLIARQRSADLVVCSGAELEVGWMPVVIGQSGNEKIVVGKPEIWKAANYVPLEGGAAAAGQIDGRRAPRAATLTSSGSPEYPARGR